MKSITEFINEAMVNEVSHAFVQRAYNKASGAQKNRIKKLYQKIYGKDVSKSDTSHIKFILDKNKQGDLTYEMDERDLADWFIYVPQDIIDKIKTVELTSESYGGYYGNDYCKIVLKIDNKKYYAEFDWSNGNSGMEEYDEMGCELTDTNIKQLEKEFDGNGEYLFDTFMHYILRELEK